MLNKYLFRPVIGVIESDTYHILPTLRFSYIKKRVDENDDKKRLKTFALLLTWINFTLGFSWTNRMKVLEIDQSELTFQKYALQQKWTLGYAVICTLIGIYISFTPNFPERIPFSMFLYAWAFIFMVNYSTKRGDFLIDEMYNDAKGMNEMLIEYLMENANERIISDRKINDLEAQLKEAKKKVRKSAPKKTVSAE